MQKKKQELHALEISFQNEGYIKPFSDKQKFKDLLPTDKLQEILKYM